MQKWRDGGERVKCNEKGLQHGLEDGAGGKLAIWRFGEGIKACESVNYRVMPAMAEVPVQYG